MRSRLLNGALVLSVVAAALLVSGRAIPDAYAASAGCTVKCPDGSSCSGDPEPGEICSCTCTFWGKQTSSCTCKELVPVVES